MWALEILGGDRTGQRFRLDRPEVTIGRQQDCDITLEEPLVSRRHARLTVGEDCTVEDLGSQNGTVVNGTRIDGAARLSERDYVQVGRTLFIVHRVDQPPLDGDSATLDSGTGLLRDEGGLARPSTILESFDALQRGGLRPGADAARRLDAVLEIVDAVASSLEMDRVLSTLLDCLLRLFPQAERGFVLLAEGPAGELHVRAIRHAHRDDEDPEVIRPISATVARMVMDEGRAVLSTDASHDDRFLESDSVADLELRSMMCAPLARPTEPPLGIIQVDARDFGGEFTGADLDVFAVLASLAGMAVERARIHAEQIQAARDRQELEAARIVQQHFLPQSTPEIAGYSFFAEYRPFHPVGGDYFGYIPLHDGRLAVAVGDVAGKGAAAALLMARICSDVRFHLAASRLSLAEAIGRLNSTLDHDVLGDRLMTFVLCALDPKKHKLTVVNAGHPPPFLRRADGAVEPIGAETGGPIFGVVPAASYREHTVDLAPGDAVVLFTDGLNEAANSNGQWFGIEGISQSLRACPADDATALGRALLARHAAFIGDAGARDDLCMVCIARG